ncbi:cytochrome P450 [Rhodocollybia butyracea]|uniref:Cytochrome P450 n=1 Tax=Rhodocollybia butyracea TaxID=206335 RepID=A0A9P5Q2H5_9AGAR|nr:cytochrome P450 [Rhodocollybia butyracea]
MINNCYTVPFSVFILGCPTSSGDMYSESGAPHTSFQCLPQKQTSWIWGHELTIFQHEASEMYLGWAASLGLVYRIKAALFQSDIVVVGDSSAAQHIFQNSNTMKLAGKGIAWAQGEDHRYQRRLLSPAFTSGAVKAMTDDIVSCVEKMTQNLRSTLTVTDAKVVDIVPVISVCALNIIGRVGFGHDFESTETKAIRSAWHQDVVTLRTFTGFMAPILINVFPWITSLPIPALPDSVVRQLVHKLAGRLISDNFKNPNVLRGNDILSILVNDCHENSEIRLTTTEILDNVSVAASGYETIAVTVEFILLELARNPAIQHKLRNELLTVASPDYDSISALEYLNAVVKEGLRLHPVTRPAERIAVQDDMIPLSQTILTENGEPLSSFAVKAGQVFRIPWALLNVNKQVWGNNAHEFIPERWIEPGGVPPADKLPHGPWVGVSSFCKTCIGYRLALSELKIIIAIVVRSFQFECTEAKIVGHLCPTVQPFADGKAVSMPLKVSLVLEL